MAASPLPLSREGGDEGGPHEGAEDRLGSCDEGIKAGRRGIACVSGSCGSDDAEIEIFVPFEGLSPSDYASSGPVDDAQDEYDNEPSFGDIKRTDAIPEDSLNEDVFQDVINQEPFDLRRQQVNFISELR